MYVRHGIRYHDCGCPYSAPCACSPSLGIDLTDGDPVLNEGPIGIDLVTGEVELNIGGFDIPL